MFNAAARLTFLSAMVLLLIASGPAAHSQSRIHQETSASTELLLDSDDTLTTTTVTRTKVRLRDSPAAVTIITQDEISASGAQNIPDLLRLVPGVDVMQPNQSQQNVSIRGFNSVYSNTVLVMIDGRRINEDLNGSVFWAKQPILLSQIKQIEVVRGPGSVLYGADAFSGVINIILKKPDENAKEQAPGKAIIQYESHASQIEEGSYTIASKNHDVAMTISAGYHGIIGVNQEKNHGIQDSSSVPIFNVDLQTKTSRGSLLFSTYNSAAKADLSTTLQFRDGSEGSNYYGLLYNEDRGAAPIIARLYWSGDKFLSTSAFGESHSEGMDAQQIRPLSSSNTLTYGAGFRGVDARSSFTGADRRSEFINSAFLQDEDHIDAYTTAFAGLRDDYHSVYGTQVSSRFSVVRHLDEQRSLRFSYGTAFAAPTFFEEYLDYSTPVARGLDEQFKANLNLRPEKITSSEVGYRAENKGGYYGADLFDNHVEEMIVGIPLQFAGAPFPTGTPTQVMFENVGSADVAGLEIEGQLQIGGGSSIRANYSYEDVQSATTQTEYFSPHNKVNLIFATDQKRILSGNVDAHYVSAVNAYGMAVPQYTTFDANIQYRMGRSLNGCTIGIAATNLLDNHHLEYMDQPGTPTDRLGAEPAVRTIRLTFSAPL